MDDECLTSKPYTIEDEGLPSPLPIRYVAATSLCEPLRSIPPLSLSLSLSPPEGEKREVDLELVWISPWVT